MTRWLAPVLIAATLAPPVAAEEAPPGLVCRVEGYDVALINGGEAAIPEGTVIAWSVPFSRSDGRHVFDRPLAPGGMVMMNGVLESSYLRPGTECRLETVTDP
jgi:hypothetical protein